MQAQASKPQELAITAAQSLQTVQTLLRAGMGCIAYLRDLLPEENFESSEQTSLRYAAVVKLVLVCPPSRVANSFTVTTITRGWSAEADKLLDYLENGIFDAIEKQYLRSFIFAVYLDPEDPKNIIEAYTFNFEYRCIAGTDIVVPIMSLGEDMEKLSLGDGEYSKDPILLTNAEGRLPTFKDVKKSLKTLIKTLIQAISQMDALPKRRYATYKAFYYPQTPASYEPPHFRPGDSEADRYFFSTHKKDEVPERWSIGKLETGWHGVNVHVASVSAYLPSAEVNYVSPLIQIEEQRRDAQERIIIWDAEKIGRLDSPHLNAKFEGCPDFPGSGIHDSGISHDVWIPIGTRCKEGATVPLSMQHLGPEFSKGRGDADTDEAATQELLFTGREEYIPECVQRLNEENSQEGADSLPPTQKVATCKGSLAETTGSLPPSDFSMQEYSLDGVMNDDIETQVIIDIMKGRTDSDRPNDKDIPKMHTQPSCSNLDTDTIESFPVQSPVSQDDIQVEMIAQKNRGNTNPTISDPVLDCDCRVLVEDDQILCEGECKRWYHICLRKDKNWEIIKVQPWYEELLGNFSRLALFRRAIKIAETYTPDSSSAFARLIGFISPKSDSGGIAHPDPKRARGKVKQQKTVKHKYVFVAASKRGQKYRDYFNPNSSVQLRVMGMEDTVVRDTFTRLTEQLFCLSLAMTLFVANLPPYLIAIAQNRASKPSVRTTRKVSSFGETNDTFMGSGPPGVQMQESTQNPVTCLPTYMNNELKRKADLKPMAGINAELNTRKRIKVSVVPAVNLYE
ncbi:HORMA-domain-containing protein [Russula earlei]|uniref:HORMA-domain-containing protein n=1 Tax=Russula earlei TaxID=71964 RepID=A0ACC0U1M8_9AGAM|nr:HORMA-domain-containing protein [Russula earlei]